MISNKQVAEPTRPPARLHLGPQQTAASPNGRTQSPDAPTAEKTLQPSHKKGLNVVPALAPKNPSPRPVASQLNTEKSVAPQPPKPDGSTQPAPVSAPPLKAPQVTRTAPAAPPLAAPHVQTSSADSSTASALPAKIPASHVTLASSAAPAIAGVASLTTFRPPATVSKMRPRHTALLLSLFFMVVLPTLISAWYLWARAEDQYASHLGFSVHRENTMSGLGILSGLSSLSGSSSSDTDIIFNYINSQQLVTEIDAEIDLRSLWSKPENDPIFKFDTSEPIEGLVKYWKDMVNVYYDSSTRLIDVRVLAFAPEDAQKITEAIFRKSTVMINKLNDIAANDNLKYATEELDRSRAEVIRTRRDMTVFRNQYQIVDPESEIVAQSTILVTLQQQLAETLINLDLLREGNSTSDPRIPPLENRIRVIEERIVAEKAKIGSDSGGEVFADVIAEYERLAAERLFAENAYQAARAAYETSLAENRRQSRYLAAHVLPTLAESSEYPKRLTRLALIAGFLSMIWAIMTLIVYSLRDRR